MYEITRNVLAEVKKAIVGKDDVISKVWIALLAEGHVLLEDVPGVGKTTMALAFSRALGLDTKRIQFTPDTMPSDIIGFSMPGKDGMVYQPGAIMTNLLLADEINRTSSKTQSALLEAMEEGQVTVDRVTHPLPQPFAVLATQNPVGSAGTQDLPNSQLDRFLMKLSMGYPDLQSQIHILRDRSGEDPLTRVQAGDFSLEDALTLGEVEQLVKEGTLQQHILPADRLFASLPAVTLTEEGAKRARNGAHAAQKHLLSGAIPPVDSLCRVYTPEGEFLMTGKGGLLDMGPPAIFCHKIFGE